MSQDRIQRLQQFVHWSRQHVTGDEKGQAQIFLDRLFQAFGRPGFFDVGGQPEFRIKKAKLLKFHRGPDYVNSRCALYPKVPGMADYCVYWLRRAHDHLPLCTPDRPEAGRAGLVGNQNIRNNQSRVGGLVRIIKPGENAGQGVGYLMDATKVVIEDARDKVGQEIDVVVTNTIQNAAGKMIFGRMEPPRAAAPDTPRAPQPATR